MSFRTRFVYWCICVQRCCCKNATDSDEIRHDALRVIKHNSTFSSTARIHILADTLINFAPTWREVISSSCFPELRAKLARSSFFFSRRLICNYAKRCFIIYMAVEICPNLGHISRLRTIRHPEVPDAPFHFCPTRAEVTFPARN